MPLYQYRCSCGDVIEALVRAGAPPPTAAEADHFCQPPPEMEGAEPGAGSWAGSEPVLTRLVTAHNIGSATPKRSRAPTPAGCGDCEGVPGTCGRQA
jgi:hypothetical protein